MLLTLWGYDIEYGSDCLVVVGVVVAVRADEDDNDVSDVDRAEYCEAFVFAQEDCMGYAIAHQSVNDNTSVVNTEYIFGENEIILLMYSAAFEQNLLSSSSMLKLLF